MSPTITIDSKEITEDVRSGLTDFELMAKYDLSPEALQVVLERLVANRAIRSAELMERGGFYDDPTNRIDTRAAPREYVTVPLPIREQGDTEMLGFVRDLSEKGLRLAGVSESIGRIDELKSFVIPAEEIANVESISLKATCRWVEKRGVELEYYVAGYEIEDISPKDLQRLKRLVRRLSFEG